LFGFFEEHMDSVIVFFGIASFEEVEREASEYGFTHGTVSRGSEHLYLWRYTAREMIAEHTAEELDVVCKALGAGVQSAFQVASRHGADAQFAMQVVLSLMTRFRPSVLDDDFGNLLLPHQLPVLN
jgi:hypothetical protein